MHTLCQIYSFRRANIICGVQYLEENPEGDLSVVGVADKRYFRRIDEAFKTLGAPNHFQSDDLYQKLMMTGTRAFNPLLGTKFFDRKFLEKNSLRFNENLTTGFELLFIVNAVMTSKDIMFIPNVFYIAPRK